MRCLVVLLLLVAVVASAFDSVVQIYTKVKIELQYKQETKTEVFVNGQLIERKIDTQYKPKETLELWVMGSGFIVFSGERKNEEFSLIMTNYHVIDLLVEKPSELKALNPCVGVFVNSVTFTDSNDRISQMTGSCGSTNMTVTLSYDIFGLVSQAAYTINGVTTTYSFTYTNGRISQITASRN